MKEEEFQKKVLSKFEGIEKRLKNIEKKLNDLENMMNTMYEDIVSEGYENEEASQMEHENNVIGVVPPHKNIKGYI